jgi:hypothetical protein
VQSQRYNVAVALYTILAQLGQLQNHAPLVRYSDFLGNGYFGDEHQRVIAPIFDLCPSAERAWTRVKTSPLLHAVFVEHPGKYEFIAHPAILEVDQINHVLYRSFSSLDSLRKFKRTRGGRTFIKFGWQDLTKAQKFDVLAEYARSTL